MGFRIVNGLVGLVVLGAVVVVFSVFPQIQPNWIQIGQAEACMERGSEYILAEEWDQASQELTEAIRLDPTNADAYFLRSAAWQSKNELEKAVSDLDAVLRLTPDDAEAYFARAEIKFDQGQASAAIADMDAVIRLTPEDAEAFCLRGMLREELGDYPAALADYRAAVRLDDEDLLALNNLAWVLSTAPDSKLRDGARAIELASRAVELDEGRDWDYFDTLAAAHAETGGFPAAVRCQSEALRLAPPEEHSNLQSRLDLYKAQKPYRLPAATK